MTLPQTSEDQVPITKLIVHRSKQVKTKCTKIKMTLPQTSEYQVPKTNSTSLQTSDQMHKIKNDTASN